VKQYKGQRTYGVLLVTVNGQPLNPRFDLQNHSSAGFEWGYGGEGPAQLALAILADCIGDNLALRHYQEFKQAVIAELPYEHWTLTEQQIRRILSCVDRGDHPRRSCL